MKKKLIIGLILLACLRGFAQSTETEIIPKNYIGINLSGNYSNITIKTSTQSQVSVSTTPFYGRRVKSFVFGAGISFGYLFNKIPTRYILNKVEYFETEKYFALTFVPIVRYYSKLNLFLTASFMVGKAGGEQTTPLLNYNLYTTSISYLTINNTNTIVGGEIGLGYAIKAGKSFLIEPTISFQKTKIEASYSYNPNALNPYNVQGYNVPSKSKYSETKNYSILYFGIGTIYRF